MLAAARAANPGGRLTEPEDIASVLVALSRSASARMTGNIIRVDGGEDLV
jgi:NAD(P)-dependent dehydrogenase (short-subunit alcohol dehydrogenase family)